MVAHVLEECPNTSRSSYIVRQSFSPPVQATIWEHRFVASKEGIS